MLADCRASSQKSATASSGVFWITPWPTLSMCFCGPACCRHLVTSLRMTSCAADRCQAEAMHCATIWPALSSSQRVLDTLDQDLGHCDMRARVYNRKLLVRGLPQRQRALRDPCCPAVPCQGPALTAPPPCLCSNPGPAHPPCFPPSFAACPPLRSQHPSMQCLLVICTQHSTAHL